MITALLAFVATLVVLGAVDLVARLARRRRPDYARIAQLESDLLGIVEPGRHVGHRRYTGPRPSGEVVVLEAGLLTPNQVRVARGGGVTTREALTAVRSFQIAAHRASSLPRVGRLADPERPQDAPRREPPHA